ncbi:MAG: bifunctional riboflavin kinase/FAD synthetase [Acidimicrobiales bacterium]
MEVVDELSRCPHPPEGTVVTIGAYDGVHIGHRRLIDEVRTLAKARGAASAVVTFDRHPALVVRPQSAPKLLTDLPTKLELLADTGVDYTVVIRFDEERAQEPADDFVRSVLVACINAQLVVVGHDFHFGHRREGNVALLRALGPELGFEVLGIDLFETDAEPISSTRIREALAAGDVVTATTLLGRPHQLRGEVVRGDARARELGFPTANVAVSDEMCLPADGVYAGWYQRPDGGRYRAAISIGSRPTFYADGAVLVEAHLLDFVGDLYAEEARVEIEARLRGQVRFDSAESLVTEMHRDVERVRGAELTG